MEDKQKERLLMILNKYYHYDDETVKKLLNYDYMFMNDKLYKCLLDSSVKNNAILLYNLLYIVVDLFNKNNIKYWIDGGTLLGAINYKGIILIDDDIDIGVMENDINKIKNIIQRYKKIKIIFKQINPVVYKIYFSKTKAFIDIILKKRYRYNNQTYIQDIRKFWDDKMLESDIFPLKNYKFGKIFVKGPRNPVPYLNKYYTLWKHSLRISHVHLNYKVISCFDDLNKIKNTFIVLKNEKYYKQPFDDKRLDIHQLKKLISEIELKLFYAMNNKLDIDYNTIKTIKN